MLVAKGPLLQRYAKGRITKLHEVERGVVVVAVADPRSGTLFQTRDAGENAIWRLSAGKRSPIVRVAELHDAGTIAGKPWVIFSRCNRPPDDEPFGSVSVLELGSSARRNVTDACRVEFNVTRVSVGGDVLAVSAHADLTETFRFYDINGGELARPNPSKDLPYNEPPLLIQAVLSPDGKTLAYLEGPDTSGVSGDTDTRVGGWVLVVQDQRSGRNVVRVRLAPPAGERDFRDFVRLDFDGRWAVLSEAGDRPVRVVDTSDARPREVALSKVRGVASFEDRR